MTDIRQKAESFVKNETQFQLGFLPTEQAHPKTGNLSQTIQQDTQAGIDLILSVDEDVVQKLRAVFAKPVFQELVEAIVASIQKGGRICFSGCGATGRLSILLDSMWRGFWQKIEQQYPELAKKCDAADLKETSFSVMTGGDRALIRSVENFEDFQSFGKRQMVENNISDKDTVVAISEGGETSSVIGTAWQGVAAGAKVFFVFNNPADLLSEKIERSGALINHPDVTVVDLCSGPMTVAGSTRMQATTAEQLFVGAALEEAIKRLLSDVINESEKSEIGIAECQPTEYADMFSRLLQALRTPQNLEILAQVCELEENLYEAGGRVTYFANNYMLDILTDTTERAPTFMLPPFRPSSDKKSPPSWAFVKHPYLDTRSAWQHMLRRMPKGLDWTPALYREMGAPEQVCQNPPELDQEQVYSFQIGCEDDASRYETPGSLAMAVLVGEEVEECLNENSKLNKGFQNSARPFKTKKILALGSNLKNSADALDWHVSYPPMPSALSLWDHLGIKLVLNTISTGTMTRMGRVFGNWMICAEASNKKLIDRGTRLIQAFTGVDYLQACETLHEVLIELAEHRKNHKAPLPPSVVAIKRLNPNTEIKVN